MKKFSPTLNGAGMIASVSILLMVTFGCMGVRKPWREYTPKPFSSSEWLAGDAIERGRMSRDMYCNEFVKCKADVSSREMALKTLGEPDLKKTIENREVWFYRVDLGSAEAMDVLPVSFDEKGRGSMGLVRGDTISILAKESEL
jgi:hypothetical protein